MENEKLDELFDVNKMEKNIKRVKRRANWKTVLISLIVIIVVIIVGSYANFNFVHKVESPIASSFLSFNEIAVPNEFVGKHERYPGFLGGENHFTTYKIIEGKVVYTGENRYGYGLFRDERLSSAIEMPSIIGESFMEEDLLLQRYNELGQREMVFFYPFSHYSTYRNDLTLLNEIPENKIMEVALSFDRDYTFEEVQSMMPKEVNLTWLWVDDIKDEDDHFQKVHDKDGNVIKHDNLVRSEYTAYGVSLIDSDGSQREEPVQWFINEIENGKKYKARWQGEFNRLYKTLSGNDGKLTEDDLHYFGAVVTGDAKSLAQLKDLSFIKASSIGVITDKY